MRTPGTSSFRWPNDTGIWHHVVSNQNVLPPICAAAVPAAAIPAFLLAAPLLRGRQGPLAWPGRPGLASGRPEEGTAPAQGTGATDVENGRLEREHRAAEIGEQQHERGGDDGRDDDGRRASQITTITHGDGRSTGRPGRPGWAGGRRRSSPVSWWCLVRVWRGGAVPPPAGPGEQDDGGDHRRHDQDENEDAQPVVAAAGRSE